MFLAGCVVIGLVALVAAFFGAPAKVPGVLVLLSLIGTGDALVGYDRPAGERLGKGLLAGLLWLALAVVLIRRWRAARRTPPPD